MSRWLLGIADDTPGGAGPPGPPGPAGPSLEQTIGDFDPIAWWRWDRGMVVGPETIEGKSSNDFAAWFPQVMTGPTAGQQDPWGGSNAVGFREAVSGAASHFITSPGTLGTKHSGASAANRVTVAPVGGRYIWVGDATDDIPFVKMSPTGVVTVVNGANVLATATPLDNGYFLLEVWSREWVLAAFDNVSVVTGDATTRVVVGDPTMGFRIYDSQTVENPLVLRIENQVAGGAELQRDPLAVPEYARQLDEIWAALGVLGVARAYDVQFDAAFAQTTGRATVFIIVDPGTINTAASYVFFTNDGLSAISFGFNPTTNQVWAGVYGTSGGTSVDPIPLGKHCLAMTWDGTDVALYVDGQIAIPPTPATVAAPHQVGIAMTHNMGWQHAVLMDQVLATADVQAVSWALLSAVTVPNPVMNNVWAILNPSLWATHPARRLAFAEAVFSPDPTATSVTVNWQVDFPGPILSDQTVTVFADGVWVGSDVGVGGSYSATYAFPAGTTQLVVRDGQTGDSAGRAYSKTVQVDGILVAEPARTRDIRVLGDSIANGFLAPRPAQEAWTMILRDLAPVTTRLSVWGWYGYELHTEGATAGDRTTLVAAFTSDIAATATVTPVVSIGINDAYFNSYGSVAAFTTAFQDFIDKLHATLPLAQVLLVGMQTCVPDVTVAPYRAAILGSAVGRPWATPVDLSTITVQLEADGVHPTAVGHAAIAAFLRTILGL